MPTYLCSPNRNQSHWLRTCTNCGATWNVHYGDHDCFPNMTNVTPLLTEERVREIVREILKEANDASD